MGKRVLLCDDEIHIVRAAQFKLSRAGYEVDCAADGQEGWEAIKRCQPDLLITDCQMPRLDGFQLVQKIRDNPKTRDLPVMMLTAKGFELSREEVFEKWGVLEVISKPFSPREMLRKIDELLASPTAQSDAAGAATAETSRPDGETT